MLPGVLAREAGDCWRAGVGHYLLGRSVSVCPFSGNRVAADNVTTLSAFSVSLSLIFFLKNGIPGKREVYHFS